MQIKNKTRRTLIAQEAVNVTDIISKSIGLIGKSEAKPLIFKTRWGIHTFGLSFPIDVLILDNKNTVVINKKRLSPNKIFLWNPKFDHVLELPEGTIVKTKTSPGDTIQFC